MQFVYKTIRIKDTSMSKGGSYILYIDIPPIYLKNYYENRTKKIKNTKSKRDN